MYPESEPQAEARVELEQVAAQSALAWRLNRDLSEFSEDVISYRQADIARYGRPGDSYVVIRAPRDFGEAILRAVE